MTLPFHSSGQLLPATERLDELVDALGVEPAAVDLAHELVEAAMQPEPDGTRWRSVTLSASSFPHGVASFPRNEVSHVRRRDWHLWADVALRMRAAGLEPPDYGDYGIENPALPTDVDPAYVSISTHLRHSCTDDRLVAKGDLLNDSQGGSREKVARVARVARMIAERPEFLGREFSAGDRWIADVADGRSSETGGSTRWRRAGTNHHVTLVSGALSSWAGS